MSLKGEANMLMLPSKTTQSLTVSLYILYISLHHTNAFQLLIWIGYNGSIVQKLYHGVLFSARAKQVDSLGK